ncbi:MAG TPA: S-layer homology domain-containing protein [Thermoanaerobaculia bacterium]|nr:S-layer homology domain-containing protein [Thermoanaerobaculia bacterium]
MSRSKTWRHFSTWLFTPLLALPVLGGSAGALLGTCGPFTDVAADTFCPFVLEIFYLGITTGTSATTYDPTSNVSRLQMATFLSRTVDGVLKRGTRKAALNQYWATQNVTVLGLTTAATTPRSVVSDGADLWVACQTSGTVARIRASDGRLQEFWTGATSAFGVLSAMGRVIVTGITNPGRLYAIDPTQPVGAVTTVATNLGVPATGITFDGTHVWTTNGASVSIVTPGATSPWTVTTVTTGFGAAGSAIFDGSNVWITDTAPPVIASPALPDGTFTNGTLVKLNASGAILQTVTVGNFPQSPAFDGSNIWVPNNQSNSVTVVRASTGAILQTLTAGIAFPTSVAFNGEQILVTGSGTAATLWKAADLSPLGSVPIGAAAGRTCSDGINFWLTLPASQKLARL